MTPSPQVLTLYTDGNDLNLTDKISFAVAGGYENAQIWYNNSSSDWNSPINMNIFLDDVFIAQVQYNGDRGNGTTPFYFAPDKDFPNTRYYGNFKNGNVLFYS